MVVAAGVLVLSGLVLFAAGIATGVTVLHWACVAVCAVAGFLLVRARRQLARAAAGEGARQGSGEGAALRRTADPGGPDGEPPVEQVEPPDALATTGLGDEVLVVDERPRYHLDGCPGLTGRAAVPLPLDEARADGFTPCGACAPDRHLAARARARRVPRDGS
ncbi:hypothetical protein OF117_20495 [Geodermatophilus sp. YIM 151500]|uniref:hypothetical protein n=1 Tax=Geodermatophilus sp. YIM 151500 TaxID=2984531 RepID=UPI0021E4EF9C|nr:hypothetical protein [Geodermatophilus sp. YIM 151500]MCV2491731.1 hypothetical protein [Geodermatophilus sp. YIM 151500]